MTAAERMRRYRTRLREQAPPDKLVALAAAEIKKTAKRLRAAEARANFAAKQAKIAAKARIATPLDTSTRCPVILADSGWRFEPYSRETGMDRAWGFEYKSQFVWDKEIPATGRRVRNQHELLYVATSGAASLRAGARQNRQTVTFCG